MAQCRYLQFIATALNPSIKLICYEYHTQINPRFQIGLREDKSICCGLSFNRFAGFLILTR
jgi:hypothetical protein